MRFSLLALALFPALVAAQPALRLDVGLAYTGSNEPFAELSATATQHVAGPAFVSLGVARANALFDVSYAADPMDPEACPDPGFCGVPAYVQNWTAVHASGGVRLTSERLAVQASAGPVLSIAELSGSDTLVGAGIGAELGVVDFYPVPSVGLGLSLHGATTTSHTWAGVRVGARVRL